MTWLKPIPGLNRRDPEHRYFLNQTPFPVSVTGVLRIQKSDFAMARIQATQDIWAPRGNSTHRALELHLLTSRTPQLCSAGCSPAELAGLVSELESLRQGDYRDWIEPLITHELWSTVQVIASERPTCCVARWVAGTFDLAYIHPTLPPAARPPWATGPTRVLADLKTLAGPDTHTYCTRAQLGAYMALEATHGQFYDYGQTIWARPGRTAFSALYSRRECLIAWAAAWTRHSVANNLL